MEIRCNYSYNQKMYQCTVTGISHSKNNAPKTIRETTIKAFKDDANTLGPLGATTAHISCLNIEKQNLKIFPKNIEKTFANLTSLNVINCGLASIARNDFKGLWNLTTLNLSHNKLTMLPDDLFADMKNLQCIHFQNNQLRFMTSMLFKPIERTLNLANFSDNVNIDDSFNNQVAAKNNLQVFLAAVDENCQPPDTKKEQKYARLENLQAKFENFRISSKFSDFTIKIRGKDFNAHKCILAAQSSVFEEMFSKEPVKVEQPFINVKNFSDQAFESFLNYFYTGRVDAGVSPVEMIQLASEFDVPDLKKMCIEKILDNLSEINALEIFNLGHDQSSDELIQMAFKFIKKVFPHIDDELMNDRKGLNRMIDIGENVDSWE